MLWFAPRKPRTGWSRPNKERIERLLAAGRDASWSALDAIEALEIPPDPGAALARNAPGQQDFEAFPRSVKRGILGPREPVETMIASAS